MATASALIECFAAGSSKKVLHPVTYMQRIIKDANLLL